MAKRRGPGQKATRPPRLNNVPPADDEQTELEVGLEAGGAKRPRPAAQDIGPARRSMDSATNGQRRASPRVVGGSDVAPTDRAAARERARHRTERKAGRQAAGVGDQGDKRRGSSRARRSGRDEAARRGNR